MNATPIPSWWAVGVSVLLVVVAVAIAAWQRLGISRDIVVAAARAFVQLLAVGPSSPGCSRTPASPVRCCGSRP